VLLLLSALASGDLAIVAPVFSLFPAVTVMWSFLIWRESIRLHQKVGLLLAIVAASLTSVS
jgi:uncharacterized membrane protein